MKKTKIVCALGAALVLSGCGNAYANISHGSDVVAKIGDVTITDGDLYPQMKESSGTEYTLTMIRQKIYENEIEVTDEMKKKEEEEYASNAKQYEATYSTDMEDYIKMMGYTDKEEYIEKVILPNIEQTELNKKYFAENTEDIMKEYKPAKARIFETTDLDKASQALEKLQDGEDFESVTEKYGDTTTYDGSEKFVYEGSGLASVVLTKLNEQTKQNTLINEVIADSTNGKYYVVYLISNEYDTIKDDINETLAADSTVTSDVMVYYLKKYNFTVYDTDVFNTLKSNYPQYLVQDPEISDTDTDSTQS